MCINFCHVYGPNWSSLEGIAVSAVGISIQQSVRQQVLELTQRGLEAV